VTYIIPTLFSHAAALYVFKDNLRSKELPKGDYHLGDLEVDGRIIFK
jgi:hypothetical protein